MESQLEVKEREARFMGRCQSWQGVGTSLARQSIAAFPMFPLSSEVRRRVVSSSEEGHCNFKRGP